MKMYVLFYEQNIKTSSAKGVQSIHIQVCVQTNEVTDDLTLILGLCFRRLQFMRVYFEKIPNVEHLPSPLAHHVAFKKLEYMASRNQFDFQMSSPLSIYLGETYL